MAIMTMVAAGLLLAGPFAAEASASVRRVAQHLRVDPAPLNSSASDVLRTKIANVLDIGGLKFAGDGDGKTNDDQAPQTITAQVAEQDIKELTKKLSPNCGERYGQQIEGKGPKMHSFRSTGTDKDAAQCKELKGNLCKSEANMHEDSTNSTGRKMVKKLKVEGNSCIPEECTDQKDLNALAEFKLKVVENLIGNHDMNVALHIDCSGSGGGVASCGGPEVAKPKAAETKSRAASTALAATAVVVMAAAIGLA